MIHSVSCNSRDCPWYRRKNKCRHPSAKSPDVASHNMERPPELCPLHDEPDLIMVDHDRNGKNVVKRQMKRAIKSLNFWLDLMNRYGPGKRRSKKV